jgi:hypothetical protein
LEATCVQALGVLAGRAAAVGDAAVVQRISGLCAGVLAAPELGGGNPDYPVDSVLGSGQMARQSAAAALRVIFSGGGRLLDAASRAAIRAACELAAADTDPFLSEYCAQILADVAVGAAARL